MKTPYNKGIAVFCILLFLTKMMHSQNIPYKLQPDWQSVAGGKYATGLWIADMNNDSWKDLVVANGNDMARQSVEIYYNNGDGTFPTSPQWQSDDIDYHGHLCCGDLDKNGFLDIVTSVYIGAAGFNDSGKIKIYYNYTGEPQKTPAFTSIPMYSFSCTLGDADGDGDLDIAAACGEMYNNKPDFAKIFFNNNGTFNSQPQWQSQNAFGGMDAAFSDIDHNGFLDLLLGCESFPNALFTSDSLGYIAQTPAWQSTESIYTNSLIIANNGINPAFAVFTNNNQLGGDGKNNKYEFNLPLPANSSAVWQSNTFTYNSGVTLADVNNDDTLDLIFGGWWEPMRIALGTTNGFAMPVNYSSSTSSVVEAIATADLRNLNLDTLTEKINITNFKKCIHLPQQNIEAIIQIRHNQQILNDTAYCHVPGENWICFSAPLLAGDSIAFDYTITKYPDIVITNWDQNKGNYIFYNQHSAGQPVINKSIAHIEVFPNPASHFINVSHVPEKNYTIELMDMQSCMIGSWLNSCKISLPRLRGGIYQLRITIENKDVVVKKIMIYQE